MSIWGILGGAGLGVAIGGPLGALVGAIAGHFLVDRPLAALRETEEAPPGARPLLFTVGVIALAAKMAKADGVVCPVEVKAFHDVFEVPDDELENVRRVFDLAKTDIAGYDAYARQLDRAFADSPEVKEELLDALFHIATADRAVHPREFAFLHDVAGILGFDDAAFGRIAARYVVPDKRDPYVVLGITRAATNEEIKRAWRRLAAETHPDRLIAKGLPEEAIRLANDKLAAINAAYEAIAAARGLR